MVAARGVCWLLVAVMVTATAAATLDKRVDDTLSKLGADCELKKDSVSCVKYKVLSVIEQLFRKESFKVTDSISVVRNEQAAAENADARSSGSWVDGAMQLVTEHDVKVQLPGAAASLTISPRALDTRGEVAATLRFHEGPSSGRAVEEARRSKLKKILIPIMVFVLLKAMTLVPLFIGALGLKAWNALQLSFFSFVISVALAVFQLCKKLAADASGWPAPAATVSAHAPWEPTGAGHQVAWGRSSDGGASAQELAYRAYRD